MRPRDRHSSPTDAVDTDGTRPLARRLRDHPVAFVLGFLGRLVVIYGLLVAPWPGVREAYARAAASVGSMVFRDTLEGWTCRFEARSDPTGDIDTDLFMSSRASGALARNGQSAFLGYFMPTALLIALVLATPLPGSRRVRALILGLLLLHAFFVFKTWIIVLHALNQVDAPALGLGYYSRWLVVFLHVVLARTPVGTMLVTCLVWVAATIRRADLESWRARVLGRAAPGRPAARAGISAQSSTGRGTHS